MSKILSLASIIMFASLLAACGNGNDQQPVANGYAYTQNNGYVGGGRRMCPPQIAMDWNMLVADRCNQARGPGDRYCADGVEAMIQRDAAFLQGPGCAVATAQSHWCPGENWRGQQYFDVNIPVLQSILTQFGGPGSFRR